MKRGPIVCCVLAACMAQLAVSSDIPDEDSPGWLTTGLDDSQWDPQPDGEPLTLGATAEFCPPIVEALARVPAGNPTSHVFNVGLSLYLATNSNDLVRETARGLDCNWARCYLFVRDQIRFAPCRGLLRGPERTLLDREGSAGDQAFLLLALLRASGYAESTIRYVSKGGFRVPLAGTADGYDAASWAGVGTNGSVAGVWYATATNFGMTAIPLTGVIGSSLETSSLWLEHLWVQLTLDGHTYDLDPSFKPRRLTDRSESILTDMDYSRSNLLASAGGTTNALCVQGLSCTGLASELDRLTARLADSWKTRGPRALATEFMGDDTIVPQDLSSDTNTFHGVIGGNAVDYLASSDSFKNSLRYSLQISHVGFTNSLWLDELGSRRVWLSFTNAVQTYPRAVLHLDDAILAMEPAGASQAADSLKLTVTNPFAPNVLAKTYAIGRSLANVYTVAVGFGGCAGGGMRDRALADIEQALGAGVPSSDIGLRSRVLQFVGHQWLEQTALIGQFNGRIDRSNFGFFYNIGLAAQTTSPYVDMQNCYTHSTVNTRRLRAYSFFASALEHAVLDQVNGVDRPAVSTVRVILLANVINKAIYLANSSNWSTVKGALVHYPAATLTTLDQALTPTSGRKVLLPQDGTITLNQWSSYAYMDYGPSGGGFSTAMIIGGPLAGGNTSVPYVPPPASVSQSYPSISLPSASSRSYTMSDPIETRAGAFLAERTDLALAGPMALSLTRRYDSRRRASAGPFGKGSSYGFPFKVDKYADPDAYMGHGAPAACAASAVACAVVNDLLDAGENAKNLAVASLIAYWWTDRLVEGAAAIEVGGRALTFVRTPDGAYVPAPGVTATLVRSNDNSYVLSERLGPTWRFNTYGYFDYVEDASGNRICMSYGTQTNLLIASNTFGGKLTFAWSGGRVSTVSDSAGRSVSYAYAPSGCLTAVTDAAGSVWRMTYGSDGALLSETEPGSAFSLFNAYNAIGQVTNQISPDGHVSTFAYAHGVRTVQRDPIGATVVSVFDDDGRLTGRTAPDGGQSAICYDAQGYAVSNV
ncbi:MAG: DUF6531 domain-containing protein, partial [Kiritimatiellae bacterium]|nr:DUF6531 domain-containing protein [Kiritimatiellia bacterium]